MKPITKATFIISAARKDQFPEHHLPECAFVGRSNVGKSSLINSLVYRKDLAKISSTPGKTRQINFYSVQSKWIFADLPGFGYAAVHKELRQGFAILNNEYLEHRKELSLVCLLVDARHDPMAIDLALIENLEIWQRQYIIAITKCDKLSKTAIVERKQQLEEIVRQCTGCHEILPYSSITGLGRIELTAVISKLRATSNAEHL